MSDKKVISISTATLVKVAVILLLIYLAYLIADILVLLFIALIFASLIDPLADWFAKKRLPRGLAVLAIYVLILGIVVLIFFLLVPLVVTQASQLTANFGAYWQKAVDGASSLKSFTAKFGLWENLRTTLPSTIKGGLGTVQSLVGSLFGFFGGVLSLGLVLVITFYMVVEEEAFIRALRSLAPSSHQQYLAQLWGRVKKKLGSWLRGQLLLDLIVGILSYIGLLILDVQYALLVGLMAGLFETIPYAGPIFSGIVAVLLAFLQTGDWPKPVLVALLFVVIQQLENHVLVPKVMQKTVGLNPIVSIVSLLIGYRLLGLPGAILAIPIATALSVVWTDVLAWRLNNKE